MCNFYFCIVGNSLLLSLFGWILKIWATNPDPTLNFKSCTHAFVFQKYFKTHSSSKSGTQNIQTSVFFPKLFICSTNSFLQKHYENIQNKLPNSTTGFEAVDSNGNTVCLSNEETASSALDWYVDRVISHISVLFSPLYLSKPCSN